MDLLLSSQPLAVRFFVAFLVVLVLIGVTAWLVRRFSAGRLGSSGRGRQPRLAVIDATSVDGRRRLVLIRRDNIEHLLMIGGPTDVVIEPNIVRGAPSREMPARANGGEAPRAAPLETAWPLQPVSEPLPVAPSPRALRSSATDEPWVPSEPGSRARSVESLGGKAAESPAKRSAPDFGAAPPRHEPEPARVETDRNLADVADQLEAALRRAPVVEAHPPVTDALAVPPTRAPLLKAVADLAMDDRIEPKIEPTIELEPADVKPEPKLEPAPKPETKAETKPAGIPKSIYDNLEAEMASLLGRSSGKP